MTNAVLGGKLDGRKAVGEESGAGHLLRKLLSAMAVGTALSAGAATFTVDAVVQRYPWNGLVDVDYTVALAENEAAPDAFGGRLVVRVVDESVTPPKTNAANVFTEMPLPLTAGRHRVTWNAAADGCATIADKLKFSIAFESYPEKYMVIDLTGGHLAPKYNVTYLDAPPPGGFNTEEYKTKKLAFRLVPAGGYMMGSPLDEPGRSADEWPHPVVITKPFYMQIFEFTRGQYETMTGKPAPDKAMYGAARPLTNLTSTDCRGEGENPTSFKMIGELCAKTGLSLELPTEAQWEWACRAGTTTPFNDGEACADVAELDGHIERLGRYKVNAEADTTLHPNYNIDVGSFAPNAWGLYDMHGNAWECTRDKYVADVAALGIVTDPLVTGTQHERAVRGGACNSTAARCRSAARAFQSQRESSGNIGYRLVAAVPGL